MKFVLLLIFAVYATAGAQAEFFQYFYSAPAQPAFNPVLQPPQIQHPQFYYQPPQPQYFPPPSPVVYRQPEPHPQDDYLGFSYHTNYDDGATSTVVFFRGAVANTTRFNNRRITVASDSLDPQITRNEEQRLQNILTARAAKNLAPTPAPFLSFSPLFSAILKNHQPGTFHYYQTEGLPANTALLKPIEASPDNDTETLDAVTTESSIETTFRSFDVQERGGFEDTTRPAFPTIPTTEIANTSEPASTVPTTEKAIAEESRSVEQVIENEIIPVEPYTEQVVTSTEKAVEPSTEAATEKPADVSTEKTIEPSTEKLLEPSTEKEVESTTAKATELSTEKLLDPTQEREDEPSTVKVTELATEKSSEETNSSQSSSEEQGSNEVSNESSSTEDITSSESMSVEQVVQTIKAEYNTTDENEESDDNSTEKLGVELTTEITKDATTTESDISNL